MNSLYWLVTITDRRSTDAFLALYAEFGVTVSLRTVGSGTAVQETLSTLGLERTEKAVLFAMITADTWPSMAERVFTSMPFSSASVAKVCRRSWNLTRLQSARSSIV